MFFLVIGQELGRRIVRNARVALDVYNVRELDPGSGFQRILVPMQTLVQIRLRRHGKDCNCAFALQFLRKSFTAGEPSLVIISPDKEEAFAGRRVGIDGDYGNPRCDSSVD